MIVRITVTNTPLTSRAIIRMLKLTLLSVLINFFGVFALAGVGAYYILSRLGRGNSYLMYRSSKKRSVKVKKA